PFERRSRYLERRDPLTRLRQMESKRTVIAEAVETFAVSIPEGRCPILSLIQECTGLLTAKEIDPEAEAVLGDRELRRLFAILLVQHTLCQRQILKFSDLGVIAFDDQSRIEPLDKKIDPHFLERFHSLGQGLHNQAFTVAVNYQARKQIAFGMNNAVGVSVEDYLPAPLVCLSEPRTPEVGIRSLLAGRDQSESDLRLVAEMSPALKTASRVEDTHS